jgi:hypothetical protein
MIFSRKRKKSFGVLLKEFERHQWHLTTGIFGMQIFFDVMRLYDRGDIAYRVANQKDFPGWAICSTKAPQHCGNHGTFLKPYLREIIPCLVPSMNGAIVHCWELTQRHPALKNYYQTSAGKFKNGQGSYESI